MSRQNRLDQILELIVEEGLIEVEKAANKFNVSRATIRRDLDILAQQQLINRTHGGATATGGSFRLPLAYKVAKHDDAKKRIGSYCVGLVKRYQVVGINGGTTTTEVVRALAGAPEFVQGEPGDQPALTVVTNALNIATELTVRHQIKIVVTGGVARPQSYELSGPFAEAVLSEVMIDIAFVGVESIDLVQGAGARHEDEARVNRQILSRARKVVVVTDSSKFRKTSFARICQLSDIDLIVTDDGLDLMTKSKLISLGVKIVIV